MEKVEGRTHIVIDEFPPKNSALACDLVAILREHCRSTDVHSLVSGSGDRHSSGQQDNAKKVIGRGLEVNS